MKTYRAVIFDLFDTLVDFDRTQIPVVTIDGRDIHTTAGETYRVLAQHATHLTFDSYYQTLSAITKEIWAMRERDHLEIPARHRYEVLFERLGLACDAAAEQCIDAMLAIHHRYMHDSTVCPRDRRKVLEALKERYLLGLLSNFDSAETGLKILATHGLRPYFSPIHISETIRYRKPRPEAFLQTAEAMGVAPREALFIGDTFALDVVGAKGVGMDVAWLDRQKTPADLERAQPDYIITRLTDLLEIL
jgi:FMN hydrolase / 5-amino-6-(5-phospho-D-ribitylamino)uracil phosphatase